ncbi:hypothetical protein RAS1_29540 [Phycisphaerae bacterium RAS1]|nr:hypothetical protein RAS1_29540 [Phycisphaerae bacterium RAS1]
MRRAVPIIAAGFVFISAALLRADIVQFKMVDINATATSVSLPGIGPTGPVSIVPNPAGTGGPVGYLDQAAAAGKLYWPVRLNAPGLAGIGVTDLDATLVGRLFGDAPNNFMVCYDMGYVNDAALGSILFSNNNKIDIGVVQFLANPPPVQVPGNFVDISDAYYFTHEEPWLRNAMDLALGDLQAYNPALPPIAPSVLDTFKAMYDANPQRELIVYLMDTGQYLGSSLSGTTVLGTIPEPATALLLAAGALLLCRRRA